MDQEGKYEVASGMERLRAAKRAREDERDRAMSHADRLAARAQEARRLWFAARPTFQEAYHNLQRELDASVVALEFFPANDLPGHEHVRFRFTSPEGSKVYVTRAFEIADDGTVRTSALHQDKRGATSGSPPTESLAPIDTLDVAAVERLLRKSLIAFIDMETD